MGPIEEAVKRILLCDDEEVLRSLLRATFDDGRYLIAEPFSPLELITVVEDLLNDRP